MSIFDNVEFTEVPPPKDDAELYSTHEGELHIVGFRLRCYRLNDGRTVISEEDIKTFFGNMGLW